MNYLKICQIISNDPKNNHYIGYVNPKIYSDWQITSPLILFMEGVHQFAVKAAKVHSNLTNRLVPVQLKEIKLHPLQSHRDFYLVGAVTPLDSLFKINFAAYPQLEAIHVTENQIAAGLITVAALSEGV